MALNSIKKTFTSCYIPRRNSSVELTQDSMINQTDENEVAENTQWGSKPFCSRILIFNNFFSVTHTV